MGISTETKLKYLLEQAWHENAGQLFGDAMPSSISQPIPAAVLIPIVQNGPDEHIILTQRTEHLKHHPGQISFPGGRLEHCDESALECALRETQEELGIDTANIRILGQMGQWLSFSGFSISVFIGMLEGPLQYQPCAEEVAEVIEIPVEHAFNPNHYEQIHLSVENQKRHFFQTYYQGKRIWGFTGSLMYMISKYYS